MQTTGQRIRTIPTNLFRLRILNRILDRIRRPCEHGHMRQNCHHCSCRHPPPHSRRSSRRRPKQGVHSFRHPRKHDHILQSSCQIRRRVLRIRCAGRHRTELHSHIPISRVVVVGMCGMWACTQSHLPHANRHFDPKRVDVLTRIDVPPGRLPGTATLSSFTTTGSSPMMGYGEDRTNAPLLLSHSFFCETWNVVGGVNPVCCFSQFWMLIYFPFPPSSLQFTSS